LLESKVPLAASASHTRDIDLLGWRWNQLFVGEAKTSPTWFTDDQVTSTVDLAAHVGADLALLVCPNPLPEGACELAGELAGRRGLKIETLMGSALMS
jgi:hypothetical protein